MAILTAFLCGLVFGFGLLISGMVDPNKIFGFLDIFGRWDPSLAIVMGVALVLAAPGLLLARRRGRPLAMAEMRWPSKHDIDRPLLAGAAIFGIGWGLSGLCPGPAIENLASLSPRVIAFVASMAVGMVALDAWRKGASYWRPHQPEPVG
jgi:uncharacterized membrane protein YedE/YeeE